MIESNWWINPWGYPCDPPCCTLKRCWVHSWAHEVIERRHSKALANDSWYQSYWCKYSQLHFSTHWIHCLFILMLPVVFVCVSVHFGWPQTSLWCHSCLHCCIPTSGTSLCLEPGHGSVRLNPHYGPEPEADWQTGTAMLNWVNCMAATLEHFKCHQRPKLTPITSQTHTCA